MDKYFLSQENIDKIARYLGKIIPVKNTPESKKTFKTFVYSQMEGIYSKFGHKKPKNISTSTFIDKLNEKTVNICIQIYEKKTGKRVKSQSNLDYQETYGNRKSTMVR